MRKIIKKKVYDTERSRFVCFFRHCNSALYQASDGEYFLANDLTHKIRRFWNSFCDTDCEECCARNRCTRQYPHVYAEQWYSTCDDNARLALTKEFHIDPKEVL